MLKDSVFVIAEAGSNWRMGTPQRDLEFAKTLIDIAADAGANAVKFQIFVQKQFMFQTPELAII